MDKSIIRHNYNNSNSNSNGNTKTKKLYKLKDQNDLTYKKIDKKNTIILKKREQQKVSKNNFEEPW